jgi:hypothetical protein
VNNLDRTYIHSSIKAQYNYSIHFSVDYIHEKIIILFFCIKMELFVHAGLYPIIFSAIH